MKRISILIVIVIILLCNQSIALGLSNRVLCSCGWCGYHPKRSVRERHVSTKNKDWHEVTIYYNSYCPDCGALFSTVYDYDEYRESHTFVNGKCKVCEWPEPQKASDNKTNNNNTNTNNNNTNTNNNNTNNNSNNRKNELRERNMLLGEKAIGRTIKVVYEVNLFEESSANSYSYGKMPIGSTATILDYKKNSVTSAFFLVRYNNTNGWVTVSNVEVTNGGSLPSSGCTHIGKWVTTVSKASNARSGPGVQYQQINIVPPNTQFKVYDCQQDNDGTHWLQIQYQGTSCWISEKRCQ